MSVKSFAALCVATLIALVFAGMAIVGQPRLESADKQGELLFPNLVTDAERLKSVVIRHGGETISLDWDGKTWQARERGNFPANREKVTDLIVSLARMTKVEGKTKAEDRYARLEVEDPAGKDAKSRQVALLDAGGKEIAGLIVGKRQDSLGSKEGGTYVRLAGDPQVWLATGEITAETAIGDWLDKNIADIKDVTVNRVTVTHPNGEKIIVARAAPQSQSLLIENLPKGAKPASEFIADEYGRLLTAMTLEDVARSEDKPFPRDKTVTALVEGLEGFQVSLELAEVAGQNWVRIKGTPPGAAPGATEGKADAAAGVDLRTDWAKQMADINRRADGWVFQVPEYQIAPLKRRMADLVKKPEAASSKPVASPN